MQAETSDGDRHVILQEHQLVRNGEFYDLTMNFTNGTIRKFENIDDVALNPQPGNGSVVVHIQEDGMDEYHRKIFLYCF
jgi:hypothetical protein